MGTSPLGVIILENYHVQPEGFETPNAFSIIFAEESGFDKKHLFIASCERHSKQWQNALKAQKSILMRNLKSCAKMPKDSEKENI